MCLGSGPKAPDVPAAAPVERDVEPAVRQGRDRARRQALAASGAAGTAVTGPGGVTVPKPLGFKTLLGE